MNNIEEKFYKTFGIEPIAKKYECKCGTSTTLHNLETCKSKFCDKKYCDQRQTGIYYPEITAEKLLELICILNETACEVLGAENIADLKNEILETCLKVYNTPILTVDGDEYDNYAIYEKIHQLFKEEE